MRMDIQLRWETFSDTTQSLDLETMVKQYEEVMIKNQLLKVCFEDTCIERDKIKVLRDQMFQESHLLQL
jgi:hypothetical protein